MEKELKKARFHLLKLEDQKEYQQFFRKMPGDISSRMYFAFMQIWLPQAQVYVRETERFLLLLMHDAATDRLCCFPPLGDWEAYSLTRPLETYRSVFKNLNRPFVMANVCEWMLPKLQAAGLSRATMRKSSDECDCQYMARDYTFSLKREQTRTELNRIEESQPLEWLDYNEQTHDAFLNALCEVYGKRLKKVDCPSFFARMLSLAKPLDMTLRMLKSNDTVLGVYACRKVESEIEILLCYAAQRPRAAEAVVRQDINRNVDAQTSCLRLSGVFHDGSLIAGRLAGIRSDQPFNYTLIE